MRPDQAKNTRLLQEAMEQYRTGDPEGAASRCREVLRKAPEMLRAHWLLGMSLIANGQYDPAREAALRGLKLAPGDPDLLHALATTYTRQGRFAESLDAIERAVAARPDEPALVATLADLHFREARYEEAGRVLDRLISAGNRHISLAMSFAQVCPRLGRQREGIELLEAGIREAGRVSPQVISAYFHLGELHDALGEFDLAFGAYEMANRLKGRRPEIDEYFASIDEMIAAWTPERLAALPPAPERDPAPVFIVGMPRSGTSLTEQILASHPGVFGAGEREALNRLVREVQTPFPGPRFHLKNPDALTARAIERMGRTALRDLKALAPAAARIIDKNPVNYLHLGLISRLFPGARVLHCVRDPMDTCLSCYFHNLAGADVMAGDLALMGRWYVAYRGVMDHWKRVLDLPIMDVVYEEMVEDQEGVTRRVVEFLGLDWQEEMLNFHETRRPTLTPSVDQVRRPMYKTSVQRWKNYEKHIGPLREALGRFAGPVPAG
jgi:cytochrome c-type biogenesis protein CcmH/NrfG